VCVCVCARVRVCVCICKGGVSPPAFEVVLGASALWCSSALTALLAARCSHNVHCCNNPLQVRHGPHAYRCSLLPSHQPSPTAAEDTVPLGPEGPIVVLWGRDQGLAAGQYAGALRCEARRRIKIKLELAPPGQITCFLSAADVAHLHATGGVCLLTPLLTPLCQPRFTAPRSAVSRRGVPGRGPD